MMDCRKVVTPEGEFCGRHTAKWDLNGCRYIQAMQHKARWKKEAESLGIQNVFVGTPKQGFKEFSRLVTEAREGGNRG